MAEDWKAGEGGRIGRTRGFAFASLTLERAWSAVFGLLCLLAVFLILSWFGIFAAIPGWARLALLVLLAIGAGFVLWRARGFRLPARQDVDARIERESRLAHQPLQAQSDRASGEDPFALALWREHQRRMAERLRGLRGGAPATRTERLDPLALRALLAMLLVTAFSYSFGPGGGRVADALAPVETELVAGARLDAWLTPPGYTGRAPIFLTDAAAGGAPSGAAIEAPAGSVLSVRLSDRTGATLAFAPASGAAEVEIPAAGADAADVAETEGAAEPTPAETGGPVAGEYELVLAESGTAEIGTGFRTLGQWSFTVTADRVPEIRFEGTPSVARNGALEIAFTVSDDYGAARGQAVVEVREPLAEGARALVPPPEINLAMPRRTRGEAEGRNSTDLTESPYAGAEVAMTLVAHDDAGQEGRSEPLEMTLPERRFTNPLARAVVEQRRILALDANAAPRVVRMLDAVTMRGDEFIENPVHHMALAAARTRIDTAFDDAGLLSAVDFLWEIALGIEDGNLSLAERRLRDAQEALSEALENGASDEEIARLMDELRAAMQEFMTAMAEAMQNMPPQSQMQMGDMQELRPQDLDRMLDQIEDLARSGSKDAAQDLLAELQRMMDNLQAMQPGQQQQAQQNPMQQQMDQLGEMLQRQQQLMDETFALGREEMRRQMEGENGEPGEGQEGEPMTAEELQRRMEELQAQQGQLQRDLQELQEQMEAEGMQPNDGLGEAGEAMGRAEGALGEGNDGEAVGQQGEAMQALRQGAEQMMQQMQQAMGQGQEGEGQPGQGQMGQGFGPGEQRSGRDPLGRQRQTQGPDFGRDVDVPDEIDIQRARQILDAIRGRLGDALSPQLEREYLERLLQTP